MAAQPHWSMEKIRIALLCVFGIAIGWVISNIWMGLAATFILYSCWLIYQARRVDLWLQKGAQRNNAPDADGVIGHIEQLIFRRKQSDKDRKKRLKTIVGWYNRSAAALPDATVVTNDRFEIVWANDAAHDYLGIRGTRDTGQRIDNLIRDLKFQRYVEENDPEAVEIEMKSPANNRLTLTVRRVAYAENLYLFSAKDISQRVQLRETRAAFVANASHELKTPLTMVTGYLELLSDDTTIPAEAQKKIAIAEENAKRMSDIVTDMLTLSRLENQQLEQSKLASVDIAEIIRDVVTELSDSKLGEGRSFTCEVDDSLLLQGSESEMKSVCNNLCFNAVQHTPENTDVNVTWQATTDGGAQLIVSDNGQGIPPQHLSHITERFYRVDGSVSREPGSTGLGLAIVKHIVSRHKGKLEISSEVGQGTSFTMRFPAQIIHHKPEQKIIDPAADSARAVGTKQ